jgi:UDP-glucose 4-epimerase
VLYDPPSSANCGGGYRLEQWPDALIRDGAVVLVIDDMSRGSQQDLEDASTGRLDLLEIDIREADALRDAFRSCRPDAVSISPRRLMFEPRFRPAHDASTNALGSINVFAAAAEAGVRRVVNTSTGGSTGPPARTELVQHLVRGVSPSV